MRGFTVTALFGVLLGASGCGKNSDNGSSGSAGAAATPIDTKPTIVTADDGSSVTTALPQLPPLTNLLGTVREDSVGVSFDPVDGAKDYRIYPLPADGDITAYSDGSLSVKNAIYRCGGMRQTFDVRNNLNKSDPALAPISMYTFSTSIDADDKKNTLGYVYLTPAADRIPVYAVAGPAMQESEVGWRETRPKIYTTSADQRAQLLAKGQRDDGIVFYVPAAPGATTHTLYGSQFSQVVSGQGWMQYKNYYFTADAMAMHQGDTVPPAPAFEVLNDADGPDSKPLMKAYYDGSQSHDELAVGPEHFRRAAYQGSQPLWYVQWPGLTEKTTLVVEALANGCPYQGFLSPEHVEAPPHQVLYTLDELQAASSTGEVFVNGQYDGVTGAAKPLARSFLTVTPKPHDPSAWDFYQGFNVGTDLGTRTEIPGCTDQNCKHWQVPAFDVSAYRLELLNGVSVVAFGQFLGQLWEAFDDAAQDVTGKMRFTATTKGNIDSDPNKYLHATMSVNIVTTGRRYPQLIISDQDAPVQENLTNPNNNTLLVQPITGPDVRLEVQAIHGLVGKGPWDVNNQAPEHRLIDYGTTTVSAQPNDSIFEHTGMDRLTKFDVYISTEKVYVFMDDEPAGCTLFPSAFKLSGPVTYTVGDVLYHEGAPDERICSVERPFPFLHKHQCTETKRQFDDLGFKSGVAKPNWDDKKFPCLPY